MGIFKRFDLSIFIWEIKDRIEEIQKKVEVFFWDEGQNNIQIWLFYYFFIRMYQTWEIGPYT